MIWPYPSFSIMRIMMCGAAAGMCVVPGAGDALAVVRQAAVAIGEEACVGGVPEAEHAPSRRALDATPERPTRRRRHHVIGPSGKYRVRPEESSRVTVARVCTTAASTAGRPRPTRDYTGRGAVTASSSWATAGCVGDDWF